MIYRVDPSKAFISSKSKDMFDSKLHRIRFQNRFLMNGGRGGGETKRVEFRSKMIPSQGSGSPVITHRRLDGRAGQFIPPLVHLLCQIKMI